MSGKRKPAIKKIEITSNNICYGPCPAPEDEVEQELSIERSGQVVLSRYAYGSCVDTPMGHVRFSIDQEKAEAIFHAIRRCFYDDYEAYMITDVGRWDMTVFDDDGNRDKFSGPLVEWNHSNAAGESVSDIVRKILGRKDLFVFDGIRL